VDVDGDLARGQRSGPVADFGAATAAFVGCVLWALLWIKGLVGLATAAFVGCVLWALLVVSGVPGFLPTSMVTWLEGNVPGL
jgi:hypothetical protein